MFQDNIFRELVVDNFAGGGGASTGMELALGCPAVIDESCHRKRQSKRAAQ